MKKELTTEQWVDFFVSDGWRALRAAVEDMLQAHRNDLEAGRGDDIEQIAINNIQLASKIEEDKWFINLLPEDLQKPRGEQNVEGNEHRGRAGHLEGSRARTGGRDA